MSIGAGVFKCRYFRDSACRKNSDEIIMRELHPGCGKTGIFLRTRLLLDNMYVLNLWQWYAELRKASGFGISACSIVSRVNLGWYRSGETSCAA